MNNEDYVYHMENLQEMSPDYICDVLDITASELLRVFNKRAERYVETEFGAIEEEEIE